MSGPRVLVVDDQPANVRLLERILKTNGYSEVITTTESPKVSEIYRAHKPDLILLDLHMPVMDGFEVLERLQVVTAGEVYLPIVVLTADITPEGPAKGPSDGGEGFSHQALSTQRRSFFEYTTCWRPAGCISGCPTGTVI